ncbi:MAG: ATP-binding protein [Planctomycetota bacterium]|nr:ATP-binding protein [Planctomycetota bacterium]
MDELIVLSGPMRGRRFLVDRDTLSIGRDPACDIVLDDEAASRRHCEIYRKDGQIRLRDLKSTNGTFVNNSRADDAPLRDGDKLVVGDTVMYLKAGRGGESTRRPTIVFAEERKREREGTRVSISADPGRLRESSGGGPPASAAMFAALYDFAVRISPLLHREALVERAMDMIFEAIPADRGVLLLTGSDGSVETKVVRARDESETGKDIAISKALLSEVIEKRESFLTVDAQSDGRLAGSDSIAEMRIGSAACAPLKLHDRLLGFVYLDTLGRSRPLGEADLRLLTAMAVVTSVCLENARLYGELMDALEYNAGILRGLSSGLIVVDARGVITKANDMALDILRSPEYAVVGRPISAIGGLKEMAEVTARTLATGTGVDRMEVSVDVKGENVPLGLSVSPLKDRAGSAVGAVVNFRSLVSIRRLEEQVRRSRHLASLGQMAAGVAHEIRNPLNSIRGFAQLLQENPTDEKAREYAGIILEEVDRMNEIVQGLLDFSRQRELTLVVTDVVSVVTAVLRDMKADIEAARVSLEYSSDAPTMTVLGNEAKLRQVFRNIILNAVQAMPDGGKLGVRVFRRRAGPEYDDSEKQEVTVSISDTGTGIAPEILPKIFDPFFTSKEVGTGLGLSISQKIVDQHGGRIEVATEVGKGSAFTVFLPAL